MNLPYYIIVLINLLSAIVIIAGNNWFYNCKSKNMATFFNFWLLQLSTFTILAFNSYIIVKN